MQIILLRSEKSVATWGLSICLITIWEDRLQGGERKGEREREKQRVRVSVLQKKPWKHKSHWVFLFYLSELRAGLLGSDLPNSDSGEASTDS